MAKLLRYAAGDVVAVPLRDRGYALGVVARSDGKGVVLGYFFGKRLGAVDEFTEPLALRSGDAAMIFRFGDLGIVKGHWPIVGRVVDWNPQKWPVPEFCRDGELRVKYDDRTLEFTSTSRSPSGDCNELPEDGLAGSGFVEIRLTRLVADRER